MRVFAYWVSRREESAEVGLINPQIGTSGEALALAKGLALCPRSLARLNSLDPRPASSFQP
jgi:hypothetical protein